LLKKTVQSYLETISVDYELLIVDNYSSDGSRDYIKMVCSGEKNRKAILLSENTGGEGLNIGFGLAKGQFLHASENDVEYLPGWDRQLLGKFREHSRLGQLCLFSPFHQEGEIWVDQPCTALVAGGSCIYVTNGNVSTTSIIRREVWDKGARWKTYDEGGFQFPSDGAFSADVRKMGYLVAWNDEHVAINWGHNIAEFVRNLPYYVENYQAKKWIGIKGFRDRLNAHGYDLLGPLPDGSYRIESMRMKEQRSQVNT
jgi:glycosyltransferase involved in cell wall biosynthesis